jgi:CRISPR/Cas system Type II protein with McrA/HNH and RuvC-like nuclease domain
VVGTFISGSHSIIFKWAEFTSNLTKDSALNTSDFISLLSDKGNVRDVEKAKRFYQEILEKEPLNCIWSGKSVSSGMHIDHLLPFSAIRNNDLWNLLPAREEMNIRKRDSIPPPELLESNSIKSRIIGIWDKIVNQQRDQFFQEVSVSLLGMSKIDEKNWEIPCYKGLIQMSDYLIHQRGLTPWKM